MYKNYTNGVQIIVRELEKKFVTLTYKIRENAQILFNNFF